MAVCDQPDVQVSEEPRHSVRRMDDERTANEVSGEDDEVASLEGAHLPDRGRQGKVAAGADQRGTCVIRPDQDNAIGDIDAQPLAVTR
ncbi:hypothetical protein ACPPVO_43235 [Dactylosporangium sp. McL0621]|uniref:hypothetical protein n=1 Tax=Dactylosporangium sp. McL0621 TaxID=3415678 RepID=UPI003CEA383F